MTRILVIEDEAPIRENVLEILDLYDYDVIEADNGLVGVEMARSYKPDLIICDVRMPELDGFGVLVEIRSHPDTASIPFIFLTASAEREAMRYGMELGADDYITKPFTASDLIAAIETRLERHAALVNEYERQLSKLEGAVTYMLPHELRTPLSIIIGYSDFLLGMGDDMSPDQLREKVRYINRSGKRLFRLVENILLYAQLEIKRANPQLTKPLRNLRTSGPENIIKQAAQRKAQEFGREDDMTLEVEPVNAVHIFEDDLKKIMEELVDNAFKFSKEGSPIKVMSSMQGGQYVVTIADEGYGMTSEQVERVDSFLQFDRQLMEQQGAGLGLVIAKELTELYGGTLEINSELHEYTRIELTFNA